jgi:hypothetical protein
MILIPAAIFFFQLGVPDGNLALMIGAGLCVFGAMFGAALLLWSVRFPIAQTPPMPGLIRGSFVVLITALLLVGGRMVLKIPNTIPWAVMPELPVVMGWMFLGAAAYSGYSLLKPSWMNAAGQMAGFLAYDLVLIVPFINRLPKTPPEQMPGMVIYTLVEAYSGLLAVY